MSREYQLRVGISTTKLVRIVPAKVIRTSKVGSWHADVKATQQNRDKSDPGEFLIGRAKEEFYKTRSLHLRVSSCGYSSLNAEEEGRRLLAVSSCWCCLAWDKRCQGTPGPGKVHPPWSSLPRGLHTVLFSQLVLACYIHTQIWCFW